MLHTIDVAHQCALTLAHKTFDTPYSINHNTHILGRGTEIEFIVIILDFERC